VSGAGVPQRKTPSATQNCDGPLWLSGAVVMSESIVLAVAGIMPRVGEHVLPAVQFAMVAP